MSKFLARHIGPNESDEKVMLEAVGEESLNDLISKTIPSSIMHDVPEIGDALSEYDALNKLKSIASKNKQYRSLIGQGYYDTITPNVILRNVLQNPGWYTAYTPYQPEISQGRLEALLNFQQMVMDLTAMDIANASLLDEATAAAEAMTLAKRSNKVNKGDVFLVSDLCHPQTIEVIETRAKNLGYEIIVGNIEELVDVNKDAFGLLIQYPATNGEISDYKALVETAKANGVVVSVAADLLALTLLTPPGEWGADIVFGSTQRFGVPLGFGGPHAAFFATKDAYKRSLPGRIVGVSVDSKGKSALRLALQTREQHIRRDKATSNICTSQVLLANIAGFYAAYHGKDGLIHIANKINAFTSILKNALVEEGFEIENKHAFDTLTIKTKKASKIIKKALEEHVNLREVGEDRLAVSFDEKTTREEVLKLIEIFGAKEVSGENDLILADMIRRSDFLTHSVFNDYHTETEMMRYMRKLEHKDIALNRAMIPLGSCTMKLNAAVEMEAITWPEFTNIHPLAPVDQAEGYMEMINDLDDKLCKLTGFSAISFQPNSGAQGEYAGLLVIRNYLDSKGEFDRDVCLIPASAHGTNPASAVMAGMRVVVVACDDMGNIDVADLHKKIAEHENRVAALMVTYPSTHGVFEEDIVDVCKAVHEAGGQVYMDGANFNAMVGISLPCEIGADVMHVNLHKTFSIPHGGGGPGVGPIGVAEHLAEYLPSKGHLGKVSAAEYGSACVLPISWMYLTMMGTEGLRKATEIAILNANYISKSLEEDYDTLYTGTNNYVAHECILDTRGFKERAGVIVDDIAKRLMDFGFHAPTMSFPVPGTLMVEPTESESKRELDRFIEAMKIIKSEIDEVAEGNIDIEDSVVRNAPHTLDDIVVKKWNRKYSIEQAVYPVESLREERYFTPVNRIDNASGDRNLVCSCPDVGLYQ